MKHSAQIAWAAYLVIVASIGAAAAWLPPIAREYPFEIGLLTLDDVHLIDVAAPPLCGAVGAIACVQVLAALAGRGRGVPGAAVFRWAQLAVFAILLALEVFWIVHMARPAWYFPAYPTEEAIRLVAGALLGGGGGALAAIAIGRAAGASLAVPVALVFLAYRMQHMPGVAPTSIFIVVAAPVVLSALALWWSGLDAAALRRLGLEPWAPGDLALGGLVLVVAVVTAALSIFNPGPIPEVVSEMTVVLYRHPWLALPGALAYGSALVFLGRRARRSADATPSRRAA